MTDIVERLREYASEDHERGCQGREYTCTCGYDEKRDPLLIEAADTIERLRAALRDVHAICNNYPHFFWWPVHRIKRFVRAALEGK